MADVKDDGGPAFPMAAGATDYGNEGMSLRDYFAGQVLAGFVAGGVKSDQEYFARWAYLYADAMLVARDK